MVGRSSPETRRIVRLLTFLVVLAVGGVLYFLKGILLPLAVAFLLSYMAMPIVRLGRRIRLPVAISIVILILGFGAILAEVGHLVYASGDEFIEQLPELLDEFRDELKAGLKFFGRDEEEIARLLPEGERFDIKAFLATVPGLRNIAISGADAVIQGFSFTLLVLLFMVFIILDRAHGFLDRRLVAAFSKEGTRSAAPIVDEVHRQIESYILFKTGISIMSGGLVTLTLVAFGVPYAGLFGLVTFLLNYIPTIGGILATIPPSVVALITLEPAIKTLPVVLILAAIQFAVGNIIEPVVFGKRLRMNPITVLFALVLWGAIWGIWGMFLAVPITAVIKIVIERSEGGRAVAALMDSD